MQPKLSIEGLAVIKDGKLVDKLSSEETKAYNFLNNKFKRGVVNTTNPEHPNKITSLEILISKTKTQLEFDGNVIHLKKKINSRVSFAFAEKISHITSQNIRNSIEVSGEENIKKICKNLFNDYNKKNIDIFNLQREFEIKYPKRKIDNCLQISELELESKVVIRGEH
ncbi:MAG: hypothetical protein H7Y18_19360 [Clostridiaceae bacterium]|nr:hypothetical protein [Clostridiaceae bacterium]